MATRSADPAPFGGAKGQPGAMTRGFGDVHADTLFDAFGEDCRGLGASRRSEIGQLLRSGRRKTRFLNLDQAISLGMDAGTLNRERIAAARRISVTKRVATRRTYRDIAVGNASEQGLLGGQALLDALGYTEAHLEGVPHEVRARCLGLANPWLFGPPHPGQRIVDVGCGAGVDALVASRHVGKEGRVIAVDVTSMMATQARDAAREARRALQVVVASVEELPIRTSWADVVVANGVLVLCQDKPGAVREMTRILRPGGRLLISDMAYGQNLEAEAWGDLDRWNMCRSGRPFVASWLKMLQSCGLEEIRVSEPFQPFSADLNPGEVRTYTMCGTVAGGCT